jgi:hypothetical protein
LGYLAKFLDVVGARTPMLSGQEIVQITNLGGIIFALVVNVGEKQVSLMGLRAVRNSFACVVFRFVEAVCVSQDDPENHVAIGRVLILLQAMAHQALRVGQLSLIT